MEFPQPIIYSVYEKAKTETVSHMESFQRTGEGESPGRVSMMEYHS